MDRRNFVATAGAALGCFLLVRKNVAAGLLPDVLECVRIGQWTLPGFAEEKIQAAYRRYCQWKGGDETVVFPTIADVHSHISELTESSGFEDKKMHLLYCQRAAKVFNADFLVNLGDTGMDISDTHSTQGGRTHMLASRASWLTLMDFAPCPAVFVMGNHDRGNQRYLSNLEVATSFNAPKYTRLLEPTFGPEMDYGYFDLAKKKTRVLFLNTSETHPGAGYGMGEDQLKFLESALGNTPDGWSVVVLSHRTPHPWLGSVCPLGEDGCCKKDASGKPVVPQNKVVSLNRCREILEAFARRKDVKLSGVVSGDSHYDNQGVLNGVRYVITQGYGGMNPKRVAPGGYHHPGDQGWWNPKKDLLIDVVAIKVNTGEMRVFRAGTTGGDRDR